MPGLLRRLWERVTSSGPTGAISGDACRDGSLPGRSGAISQGTDSDFAWLLPPDTVTDPALWDRHWLAVVEHHGAGLIDMFCRDGVLVDAMRASGLRSVLCIGSGISMEPHALAAAGFEVTSLDLSSTAATLSAGAVPPPELLDGLLEGRARRPDGRIEFVTGDLRDSSLCPGPFDVIIERRTLQLFSERERPSAMTAVAGRLARRGIFVSHCHDGWWKPPAQPYHATRAWFEGERWPEWSDDAPLAGRVAWLCLTTG